MYYSQESQDRFLEEQVFKGYKDGVFVDIGAHDGVTFNNTLFFEKNHNWRGINVEPIKTVYDQLLVNRPNCININVAVSNKEGVADFLLNIGASEMISGLTETYDPRHCHRLHYETERYNSRNEIIQVPTRRLESILDEHAIKRVNYLSVDVEGAEFEVLKSVNFEKVFIDVIGFENNFEDVSAPVVAYLEQNNYVVIHKCVDIIMIHTASPFFAESTTTSSMK